MVVLIKVGDVDMTIFELRENIEKYKMLEIEKNKIQINDSIEKEDKKSRIMELRQIENNIFSNITNGVKIEGDVLIDEVIKITIDFLTKYGIPKEEIINNLSNIKWFTTDTILVHGGPFVNFGNSIGVDFKYVNFNEEGYFDSFKSEYYSFLKYVLVHELLHKCSIYKNYSKITSFSGDAMSEGCTDMLALMISGGNEYASKNYDFFVKIFSFFTILVGIENIVDDYINNIGKWPNLEKLFCHSGLSERDFLQFQVDLSALLQLTQNANKDSNLISELEEKQIQIITFLKENILDKKVNTNTDYQNNLNKNFLHLFSNYNKGLSSTNGRTK